MSNTHLTTRQVLQFIDGTLDYASQAQCTNHLAVCERCRKEVDLHKAIAKASRRQTSVRTSSGFIKAVMARVVPEREKTWKARLVNNLGNVIAMALVLAVLGYAITNPALFKVQGQSTQQSFIPQSVSDTYGAIVKTLSEKTDAAAKRLTASTGTENSRTVLLTIVSLLILVALDQFVLKRYISMRTRH